jgi:hypothetical protein
MIGDWGLTVHVVLSLEHCPPRYSETGFFWNKELRTAEAAQGYHAPRWALAVLVDASRA